MKVLKERIHALTQGIDNISVVLDIANTLREAIKHCKAGWGRGGKGVQGPTQCASEFLIASHNYYHHTKTANIHNKCIFHRNISLTNSKNTKEKEEWNKCPKLISIPFFLSIHILQTPETCG